MATTTKLVITYATSEGSSTTHSWNHAKTNISGEQASAIASTTIANGSIFAKVPVLAKTAKLVTTTDTELEIE